MEKLEKRMYFLVPYNISPIQQAIQAGHAALEYAYKYKDDSDYIDFIENNKTWIILNGGTTNDERELGTGISKGSLNQALDSIIEEGRLRIKYSFFREPDLNNALTAICLVVDERVFNREDYPDFKEWAQKELYNPTIIPNNLYFLMDEEDRNNLLWNNFKKDVGEDIAFLKELLNTKKLA